MKGRLNEQEARHWAEGLRAAYEIDDAASFAAHVLGREAKLTDLNARERLSVQVAARAAYAPVEQAQFARLQANWDAMSLAQANREAAACLR